MKTSIKQIIVVSTIILFSFAFSNTNKVEAAGGYNCSVGAYGITTCAPTGIIFQDGTEGQLSTLDAVAIGVAFAAGLGLILNGKFIKSKIGK